jgi:hypothetical protein
MVPKDAYALMSSPWQHVTLHGKGDFVDGIEWRILR